MLSEADASGAVSASCRCAVPSSCWTVAPAAPASDAWPFSLSDTAASGAAAGSLPTSAAAHASSPSEGCACSDATLSAEDDDALSVPGGPSVVWDVPWASLPVWVSAVLGLDPCDWLPSRTLPGRPWFLRLEPCLRRLAQAQGYVLQAQPPRHTRHQHTRGLPVAASPH